MRSIHTVAYISCALSLLSAGCSLESTDDSTVRPGDKDTTYTSDAGNMKVHFETEASADPDLLDDVAAVETECGEAVGIRVGISDEDGVAQECSELWVMDVSGDYAGGASGDHYIADCFFTVSPGVWYIDEVSALDSDLNELSCCSSSYPSAVTVLEEETTEVGALIQCDTEGNGALDIYATINTPPEIVEVTISPSKFGETCSVITLTAEAVDPEGDAVTYSWEILDGPADAASSLLADGSSAYFSSATAGDFTLQVTATDELDASHSLSFPIHIMDEGAEDCDPDDLTLEASLAADVEVGG